MSEHHLDIVRQVLDRQVVDANHYNCGKVDDIELDLDGKTPHVTAIFVGNDLAGNRLPEFAGWVSQKLFGRSRVKIPWSDVSVITEEIKLTKNAEEYGLNERSGFVYRFIEKLPGAWKK
jgi:sporulation protein YlmC with PRC-barrel domain